MNQQIENYYHEHSDRVYRYIFLLVRNKENAEDLTQETFYKAHKGMSSFNGEASPATWLLKIARNVTFDYFRKKRIIQFFSWGDEHDQEASSIAPDASAEKKEQILELYDAINRLKKDYRDVIILRKIQEFPIKDTAYILGWTEAKVKTKSGRAMEALKQELAGKDGVIHESF
ncbi:RNA polymerase sigma factor [Planococcus halotolerans]|uniref:RNA polymerase sigma factor n=1 Tax=Planococcus halotolerans TaxID=2233542 RepID=UPI00197CB19B|nr:RNA polymerase sigma factor [Planococcus halotolerans]